MDKQSVVKNLTGFGYPESKAREIYALYGRSKKLKDLIDYITTKQFVERFERKAV